VATGRDSAACFDPRQSRLPLGRAWFFHFQNGEQEMPADAMMVSIAVFAVFVGFAAVLFWADKQTSSSGGKSGASSQRRRSF
jgi:hypothetical protein